MSYYKNTALIVVALLISVGVASTAFAQGPTPAPARKKDVEGQTTIPRKVETRSLERASEQVKIRTTAVPEKLRVPHTRASGLVSHLERIIQKLSGIHETLTSKVKTLQARTAATAEMETLLNTAEDALATATEHIGEAKKGLNEIADPTTARELFTKAKEHLALAKENVVTARKSLNEVIKLIRASLNANERSDLRDIKKSTTATPATTGTKTTPATE